MPAISASARVLVTGGSGYLGALSIKSLLDHGLSVLAVYRRQSAVDYALQTFKEHGDRLAVAIIPDMLKEGAFDEVVKEVDAVVHTASPVSFTAANPDELVRPAVDATFGILKSVHGAGARVKRVVITSSVAALAAAWHAKEFKTFGPADWNDISVDNLKNFGMKSDPRDWYAASKTIAEKTAWNYVADGKPSFDLVTVLPSFCLGPWIHDIPTKDSMASSLAYLAKYLTNDPPPAHVSSFVDMCDVAEIQTLALLNDKAGGERLIASAGFFNTEQIYEIIDEAEPPFPEGITPKRERKPDQTYPVGWDSSRTVELLAGFAFKPFKKSILEHLRLLEQKGWLGQ